MLSFVEFWNRIYYSIYSIYVFVDRNICGKAIVFLICSPLYKLDFTKKRLKKYGMDTYEKWVDVINDTTGNPSSPFCLYFCSSAMALVTLGPILLCANILVIFCGEPIHSIIVGHYGAFFAILCFIEFLFLYFILWKNDCYLRYFAEFQKEGRKKRIIWGLGVLFYSICITIAWFRTLLLT